MSILKEGKPVGLACDHAGYEMKQIVMRELDVRGIAYKDFGTYSTDSCDYPDFAHPLALAVEAGECYPGIAICGSGNGINMTLNKHQGIRAALCWTTEIAALARQHNDANVLVMPGRFISGELCRDSRRIFEYRFRGRPPSKENRQNTRWPLVWEEGLPFDNDRHIANVAGDWRLFFGND